ncbi:MAG: haloacid dehalogenase type II [Burkholderiaceae bacterium]
MKRISDFKVLTFDTYGTLIDWETGIYNGLEPLIEKAGLDDKPRDDILAMFARHESDQQAQTPTMVYMQLLSVVYQRLATEWDVKVSQEEANIFGASVPDWPEFADSPRALQYLKHHFKIVTLTNCDRLSYRGSNLRLRIGFDAIYTAQDIGSYKPSPRNFEYILQRLEQDFGLGRADILHTAQSLFHDHAQANRFGLANAWIDRRHATKGWGATMPPPGSPTYDYRFDSMMDMVRAHRQELATR